VRILPAPLATSLNFGPGVSIGTTVTVMNLRETSQNTLQTLWAQDFTAKLLSPKI